MQEMFSLDCKYFDKKFPSVSSLVNYVISSGMDPDYEITKNGVPTGEDLIDLIQF